MATHKIVEVAAGLSQPSSTRLLADRLAAATLSKLAARGLDAEVQVIELRDFAHDVTSNLLTNFPRPALAGVVDTPTPTAVYAASTDWDGGMEQQRTLQDRIDRAAGELAELVAARPAAADRPAADLGSIPFEQLLAHG